MQFISNKMCAFAAVGAFLSLTGCHSQELFGARDSGSSSVEIKDGKITDSRDGQKYGVALINGVYWMNENLRFADSTKMKNLKENSWCHQDDKDCSKFGRLYSWSAAMDVEKKYISTGLNRNEYNVNGICPDGMRLPTLGDWSNLQIYVEMYNGGEGSATSIKSIKTWDESEDVNAPTNRFGFNAKAAGRRNNDGETFLSTGRIAYFWTTKENDNGTASGVQLSNEVNDIQIGQFYKDHGLSVRCVVDARNADVSGDLDSTFIDEIPHNYGSLKYEGETYRTIHLAGLEWMADNMNYDVDGSHCYNDDKDYCKEYGRLYTYEAAKEICPEGWRLPTAKDVSAFSANVGMSSILRSRTGWTDKASRGLDYWGFDAKAAGGRDGGDYFDLKSSAYFWLGDDAVNGSSSAWWINYYDNYPKVVAKKTTNEFSVRCVKK